MCWCVRVGVGVCGCVCVCVCVCKKVKLESCYFAGGIQCQILSRYCGVAKISWFLTDFFAFLDWSMSARKSSYITKNMVVVVLLLPIFFGFVNMNYYHYSCGC